MPKIVILIIIVDSDQFSTGPFLTQKLDFFIGNLIGSFHKTNHIGKEAVQTKQRNDSFKHYILCPQ